jgi:hypothetical protein
MLAAFPTERVWEPCGYHLEVTELRDKELGRSRDSDSRAACPHHLGKPTPDTLVPVLAHHNQDAKSQQRRNLIGFAWVTCYTWGKRPTPVQQDHLQ